MKKICIICKKDSMGEIVKSALLNKISLDGIEFEEVKAPKEADTIYVHFQGKSFPSIKNVIYFDLGEQGIEYLQPKVSDLIKHRYFDDVEGADVVEVNGTEQAQKILKYLLNEDIKELEVDEVLKWDFIYILSNFQFGSLRYGFKSQMTEWGISEEEMEILHNMVMDTISYRGGLLAETLRKFKYIHFNNQKLLPNLGDNIFVNCIQMLNTALWRQSKKEGSDDFKKDTSKMYEHRNAILKTIKESLKGSDAFKRYFKFGNNGMYLLFIPDETLKDGEIAIPAPTFNGVPRLYPKLGSKILATRHPITTLMLSMKVVKYTNSGSIRMNTATALALYGDADGDSQCISFIPPKMRYSGVKELEEFREAAGIKLESSSKRVKKQFSVDEFDLTPVEDKKKLYKTSLEQAQAKLITKELTGAFGSIERAVILTMLVQGIEMTPEFLFQKSWLSQIPVQAKNILERVKTGEINELEKETILLFFECSRNVNLAVTTISKLLGKTPSETRDVIVSWKGGKTINKKQFNDFDKTLNKVISKLMTF